MVSVLLTGVLISSMVQAPAGAPRQEPPPAGAVSTAAGPGAYLATLVDALGSFDFDKRTEAARSLRRQAPDVVGAVLQRAARMHADEYVRFRSLVLLSALNVPGTDTLMQELLGDRNDRVRTVAYQWFGRHPQPAIIPRLVGALGTERSEFVRPALTRALAAQGPDTRVRAALQPLVMRGEDLFRGAVIDALGDFAGSYALADLIAVSRLDGPLQDDAITAIGKLGDSSLRVTMAEIQKVAPRDRQPTVSMALCLLGIDADEQRRFLSNTLDFVLKSTTYQPLLRSVVHALGVLAVRGQTEALGQLLDAATRAPEEGRAPIALSVGLVALRNPDVTLRVLEGRTDPLPAIDLIGEAFDMLSEDFDEEQFYSRVRAVYWEAPDRSARRRVAQLLIEKLEF